MFEDSGKFMRNHRLVTISFLTSEKKYEVIFMPFVFVNTEEAGIKGIEK